jgi:hypothetical protein
MKLSDALVKIALDEVGTEEIDGTNCGPRVNEYKAATNLPPKESWPWCAAFVCWCVRAAMRAANVVETVGFKRPTTAGAWDFENWSKRQDQTTQTKREPGNDIKAGDIVIFRFSHIGIAVSSPDYNGYVETVEGNTDGQGSREGGAVLRKQRHVSKVKTRIRFMV